LPLYCDFAAELRVDRLLGVGDQEPSIGELLIRKLLIGELSIGELSIGELSIGEL